jgi:hypothetical protein
MCESKCELRWSYRPDDGGEPGHGEGSLGDVGRVDGVRFEVGDAAGAELLLVRREGSARVGEDGQGGRAVGPPCLGIIVELVIF